jgi:hypothetical protein
MKYTAFLILIACIVFPPLTAYAHGINFLRQAVGSYTVDVGYNVIVVTPRSPVVFDFLLWEGNELESEDEGQAVPVTNVWFRVEDEQGRAQFNANIGQPVFGRLALLYAFPVAGDYTLQVRYEREGNVLTEASFPLTVESDGGTPGTGNSSDFFVGGVFGLLAGGALAYFALRRR